MVHEFTATILGEIRLETKKAAASTLVTAQENIAQILTLVSIPGGYSKLSYSQRKFLLAAILGSVVPADKKIREVEMLRLQSHLKLKYSMSAESLKQALSFADQGLDNDQLQQMTKQLPELLSIEDRTNLIGMLWDIAMCDLNLHSAEETLVYKVADIAGVTRKRVVEQQAIAASHNNA
jgi:uncharacterized tellurite resistance protein B-like protein